MRMVIVRNGHEEEWALEADDRGQHLALKSPDGETWIAEGPNLWESFRQLRRSIEPLGLRLCCNGARINACVSRMGIEMGGGGGVYLVKLGHPVRHRRQLVSLFGYAPARKVVTLTEQDAFYERWLRSLG